MNFVLRSLLKSNFPLFYCCLLSVLLLSVLPLFAESPQKELHSRQVLIIQSGYEGYLWTESLNRGIQDVFSSAPEATNFFFEYIDTKRNHGGTYFADLRNFWEIKYRNQQIDLIITCDTPAYELLLKNRSSLFKDIPLVFTGVNRFNPTSLKGKKLITGIVEENDFKATVDIALQLHPKIKKLVFIIPGAQSYRLQWVKDLPARYREEVEQVIITGKELGEIDREFDALGPNIIAILLSSVVPIDGIYIPYQQLVPHLAKNRPFPFYTLWDSTLGQGIVGGKLISGEWQGREAAKLALKILQGTPVSELPVIERGSNRYMFDWQQLQRFNIDLSDLPAEAVVINRPISFYAQNKRLVQMTLTCIFILVILVISLATALIRLKKVESKVLLSDEILEQMPEAIVLIGMDGNIEKWLGRAEDIFGYSESECLGRPFAFDQSFEVRTAITGQIEKAIEKKGSFVGETSCLRKDGSLVPIEVTSTRAFSRSGIAMGTISILQDITERRQAKESLRASESRFRKMVAKSPMPTMINGQNQEIVFVNDKLTELFGYRLEDIDTEKKWWESAYPDANYRKRVKNTWDLAIKRAIVDDRDIEVQEWDLTTRDGSVHRCEFYMVPIEELSLVIVNDISPRVREASEKSRLELQLQQAQKMEAIGTLAGGIAHDFNNILAVILGYAELAKDEAPANSVIEKDLDQVIVGGNRAKELVKQILAFSRQEKVERLPMKVQVLLKETMRMLRPSLPSTIEIQTEIDPLCGFILADPTQVHQIIMNICTNANHAMDKSGGRLNIELKRISIDEENEHSSLRSGDYVVLVVADTGEGIAPNNIGKIFEPYFTTKEIGKGTGMGLATIHGIIREYGGRIDVVSVLGHGSAFSVYFPVITAVETIENTVLEETPQGRGRILLVDDEELLLTVGKKVLERLGYRVTTKSSSLEALAIFKERPNAFDAIITDQTMPDMVGSDLAQEILKIRADIPIILCTGYSDQFDTDMAHSLGIREFALKPLTKATLANLLSGVLNA
ncbi:hybrid sensor histidine kinase/response regulator [Desulfotalea psychrophila]|uniref:histidine kinase n=1 Tax=Desulfotalea psychrophila (strain LSv54 / DSM 12343) TaxID=177439 RepID=Q6ALX0_DESPS|nr:ABC transporter substrate binding protein [Desulfotalea psychrophila]CAG36655.1 related to two-component system sensory/regulatory protein (Ntr family) [Desulfotalea psychrophila LSv54]